MTPSTTRYLLRDALSGLWLRAEFDSTWSESGARRRIASWDEFTTNRADAVSYLRQSEAMTCWLRRRELFPALTIVEIELPPRKPRRDCLTEDHDDGTAAEAR